MIERVIVERDELRLEICAMRGHYVEGAEEVHPKLLEVIRAEPWAQDCAAVDRFEQDEVDSVLCAQCACPACAPVIESVHFRACVA